MNTAASPRIIVAIFFMQAFASGGIFTRIPDIQLGLGLSESILGIALSAASAGGLISLAISSMLVARFGTKPIIVLGLTVIALAPLIAALASGMVLLMIAMVLGGVSFSLTNVAMNVEADRIEAATGERVMNRCHGFWSLGMLAASLIGVGARAVPVSAALHFAAILPFALIAILVVAQTLNPAPQRGVRKRTTGFARPDHMTLMLALFGVSASIAQSTTQNWSVIFMRETFAAPDWIDSLTLPAFLLAMSVARLFADAWISAYGAARVSRVLAIVALTGSALVAASPTLWIALTGFALQGIGTAALFPIMITAAAAATHRPSEESVSAVILLTALVMLVAPAVVGWTAEAAGLRIAFAMIVPLFLITVRLAYLAEKPVD